MPLGKVLTEAVTHAWSIGSLIHGSLTGQAFLEAPSQRHLHHMADQSLRQLGVPSTIAPVP